MELRKDYFLDRFVIISTGRSKRPKQFKQEKEKNSKNCFFCLGMENQTPPEIGRLGKGKWSMRWFDNKFPAVKREGDPVVQTHNNFFTFASAFGFHEVIVETNNHKKQLWDLPKKQITNLLGVYADRISALKNRENIHYVSVFKNHGKLAGTSIVHSHSQIIAYNKWPNLIKDKIMAIRNFGRCPYCDILNIEKKSLRRCFENDSFVAFTPYASRFNYEIWIFPIEHFKNISDFTIDQLSDLADILKRVLVRLKKINCSYNLELFYSPDNEDLHFHIEISPRIATWGGFELATNDIINSVSPEEAAKFYRGE